MISQFYDDIVVCRHPHYGIRKCHCVVVWHNLTVLSGDYGFSSVSFLQSSNRLRKPCPCFSRSHDRLLVAHQPGGIPCLSWWVRFEHHGDVKGYCWEGDIDDILEFSSSNRITQLETSSFLPFSNSAHTLCHFPQSRLNRKQTFGQCKSFRCRV